MKRPILKAIGLSLLLTSGVLGASRQVVVVAETPEKTTIPATAEGVWQAIDAKAAELKKTIDKGDLGQVHHEAFAIRDLVAALPARSGALAPEKLAKVASGVKFVATLAERLDASGDAKDAAATKQNFEKLSTVLASLRANYPPTK